MADISTRHVGSGCGIILIGIPGLPNGFPELAGI
jgi:hypothetical protein